MSSTHTQLIQAVIDYCAHSEVFEVKHFDTAGHRAKQSLNKIKRLVDTRRAEIRTIEKQNREIRNANNPPVEFQFKSHNFGCHDTPPDN